MTPMLDRFKQNVTDYAAGKTWYWYLPLWLFGSYIFLQLFQMDMVGGQLPGVLIIPYSFNFALHEVSHIVVAFLPPVLVAAAGSGSELLLGTGLVIMALWQRSYFAILYAALWFALACQSAGQYMADAVPQQIPLVSLGGALSGQDAKHDWNFVFGQLHLLPVSGLIGMSLRVAGMVVAMSALVFTAWVLYMMSSAPRHANVEEASQTTPGLLRQDNGVFAPSRKSLQKTASEDDTPPPGAHDSFS